VRKRTILPVFIDFQIPNDCSEQHDWAFHKKIPLLAYPRPIQVQHDGISCFISIGYIRHKGGIDWVAPVASAWVIEIDNVKSGFYLIFIGMFE